MVRLSSLISEKVWLSLQILVEITQNVDANFRTELAQSDNGRFRYRIFKHITQMPPASLNVRLYHAYTQPIYDMVFRSCMDEHVFLLINNVNRGNMMKKLILVTSAIFIFSFASINAMADFAPIPKCVNGSWAVPAGWILIGGTNPNCTASERPQTNHVVGVSSFGAPLGMLFTFALPNNQLVRIYTTEYIIASGGMWKSGGIALVCPNDTGTTLLQNCPISKVSAK